MFADRRPVNAAGAARADTVALAWRCSWSRSARAPSGTPRGARGAVGLGEHAAFMDGLVAAGLIVLGGPLDDVRVAHAVEAAHRTPSARRSRATPGATATALGAVERWTIRLDGRGGAQLVGAGRRRPVAPVAPGRRRATAAMRLGDVGRRASRHRRRCAIVRGDRAGHQRRPRHDARPSTIVRGRSRTWRCDAGPRTRDAQHRTSRRAGARCARRAPKCTSFALRPLPGALPSATISRDERPSARPKSRNAVRARATRCARRAARRAAASWICVSQREEGPARRRPGDRKSRS